MNAIIMAAGTASRFFPISEETPKGLLDVRGEILIERQIRQLREAGISDITVVTGYKAEQFAYLREKFGVSLVHNEDYNRYNNSSSLVRVADRLGDTFLCCSDHYFARNVFLDCDGESYYATRYSDGPTDEWCCETGEGDRITAVTVGGRDAWYMAGHACFNAAFSARFAPLLREAYAADESVRHGYWEDLFIRHLDELPMKIRRYGADEIHEFDSLAELRQFDPSWWDDTRCRLLKTICRALGCRERDFEGFARIGGMSNKNYRIRFAGRDYVLRVPGYCSGEMVDRANEEFNARVASSLGVTPAVRYFEAESGIKLADFIHEAETLHADTILEDGILDQIADIYRRVHGAATPLRNRFDIFAEMEKYDRLIARVGATMYPGWEEVRPRIMALRERLVALGSVLTPCHNDAVPENFVKAGDGRLWLIDWEYSGMNDPMADFAALFLENDFPEERRAYILGKYFDGPVPAGVHERILCFEILWDALWAQWTVIKEAGDDDFGTYGMDRYRRALDNLNKLEHHGN